MVIFLRKTFFSTFIKKYYRCFYTPVNTVMQNFSLNSLIKSSKNSLSENYKPVPTKSGLNAYSNVHTSQRWSGIFPRKLIGKKRLTGFWPGMLSISRSLHVEAQKKKWKKNLVKTLCDKVIGKTFILSLLLLHSISTQSQYVPI